MLADREPEDGEALRGVARARGFRKDPVDELNRHLAQVETIKKFTILPRNLTIEDGELTPTLKVKRSVVNQNFAAEIDSMY